MAKSLTAGDKIILGSGYIYIVDAVGSDIPERDELEKEDNLLGYILSGATLNYSGTWYEAKDDMGKVSKTILTEETVTLKSGLMTWCGKTLQKLCSTARVSEVAGIRTVKIGGIGNQDGKAYIIHFVHKDETDGTMTLTIKGQNQAGFELAFAKDKETVLNAEFKALPCDSEGTLCTYTEEIPTAVVG